MIEEDPAGRIRRSLVAAMATPGFYPHPVGEIVQCETHISTVFLAGDFAYKIKKPVDFGFLDFTTLEKRKYFCQQEIDLNRRLTSDVYLDVVPISFENHRFFLHGYGPVVEYAVKMRRLSESRSMLKKLREKNLSQKHIEELADRLAAFYKRAATGPQIDPYGAWETVRENCEENFSQIAPFSGNLIGERVFQIIQAASRSFLFRRKALFQRRISEGKIRDCHGDLRTGHVYLTKPIQIIDCIEFNERFRYADVTADLAFLSTDLDFENAPAVSRAILDAYVDQSGDRDIFILLDFYKCYRAVVLCKIRCFRLAENNLARCEREKLLGETRRFMELAYQYAAHFSRPTLWIVCGMPASGKSTIAEAVGRAFDMNVIRSDVVRKELFRITPEKTVDLPFGKGIYAKGPNALTYGRLLLMAQERLERGQSIILDATFSQKHQRSEALRLSRDMDVNLIFVECTAPSAILKNRLKRRESGGGVSDARLHHLKDVTAGFEPLSELPEETRIRVDTTRPLDESLRQILTRDYLLKSNQSDR